MGIFATTALFDDLGQYPQTADSYGLIHADLVPENVMTKGDKYYTYAEDALIEGYRTHRQMPDDQLAKLPMFTAARSLTYLGWVHTRAGTETATELTPMLIQMSCDAVSEYLATR